MGAEVIRTKNFVADAAKFILAAADDSLGQRGQFRVALSGGNTPRPVYREWARLGREWDKMIITFGDERCVPPDDEQSNFRMARESLFDPAGVPAKSILRMRGEIEPPVAAREYEQKLNQLAQDRGEQLYQHDLILLGMGDDGHTASLFPGTEALNDTGRKVVENFVPKFKSWRLTMTLPLINHARCVCFLVNAAKNPELIERVVGGDHQYPAARVQPSAGRLVWILGETA
ncbi:MAG TPA: 6-phosphogluconolactonase [Chthoniobacterales bacterium]|nr:6-phosphogluconolactonase [Chthoniobacterales bacterium]